MSHPTPLQMSMYADNALPADEANIVVSHLDTCDACRTLLSAHQSETLFLNSAMHNDEPDLAELVIPEFSRPASLRGFAMVNLATGLVIWAAQFLWKTIFGELIVNAADWLTSIYLPDIYAVASSTALYFIEEGTAMFDAYLGFIIVSLLMITALSIVLVRYRARTTAGLFVLVATLGAVTMPAPVSALEIRRDENNVTIAASETIDDTLIVAAETILIEGTVTGDVIAAGATIDISGSVGGNLITFAETVNVRGDVGGLALGAASSYNLNAATVGGDLWAAGESVRVDGDSRVNRNATVAGQKTVIEGSVASDVTAFSESVEISGNIGQDLEAFAGRVRLLGDAHVVGDLRFRSADKDRLFRSDNARVDGEVEFIGIPEEFRERNPYATVQFYLWQVARLIAAFLVGLALFWLVPGLRNLAIGAGIEGLKSAGIGFLTIVSVPITAVLAAVTLVGLPFSFFAVVGLVTGVYLAKIVVAEVIGRMLFAQDSRPVLSLLVGLSIVIVAVNLPFIGGIVNFLLTIIGLGLLVQYLFGRVSNRKAV